MSALVRVGIVVRDARDNAAGGDLVQARAIGKFLRGQGCQVEFVTGHRFEPTGWDWAILFNAALLPGTLFAADQCRKRQVPYVLFPVFWDLRSIIPKGQRQALSTVTSRGQLQETGGFASGVRAKGNELRRSEVGSENVDGREPPIGGASGGGRCSRLPQ